MCYIYSLINELVNEGYTVNTEIVTEVISERSDLQNIEKKKAKQSANVLIKCVSKLEYLKEILENMAVIPRYCEEDISYMEINGWEKIAFPMVCFCDIHLKRLVHHKKNYGDYAIGLNRDWGINSGVQPVQYINPNSELNKDFSSIFSKAITEELDEEISDLLLKRLLYLKPISGIMKIQEKGIYVDKERIFQDEKEWRFVPDEKIEETDLNLLIQPQISHPHICNIESLGIKKNPQLWLRFELHDIKYIIVNNNSERDEIIDFILNLKNIIDKDRYILISKIMVYEIFQEDW